MGGQDDSDLIDYAPPTANEIQERQAIALESIALSLQQLVKVLNTKKK